MSTKIPFTDLPSSMLVIEEDRELTPIMAKSKIIPIRSGIALKIDEKEKKLFVDEARKRVLNPTTTQ